MIAYGLLILALGLGLAAVLRWGLLNPPAQRVAAIIVLVAFVPLAVLGLREFAKDKRSRAGR